MSQSDAQPFDLVVLMVRRWRTIVLFALLGVAGATTYAMVAPKWYEATLTVVPSQRSQDAASGLAAKLPGIGGLGSSLSTDVERIHAVLRSSSVSDEVIAKFDLKNRYGKEHLAHARAALWDHCATSVDRKSSVVALTCEDKDPQIAVSIAAYFGEVGNRVFGRISASSAREERRFLETQVIKNRNDVDEASRKLRAFQETHRVVDLGEQSKAVISAMATIKGELVSKQLQLSYLSSFSSRGEAGVVQLQQQIGIMESKLKDLEGPRFVQVPGSGSAAGGAAGSGAAPNARPDADGEKSKFFPDVMNVPELRFELEQLIREQKMQETVLFLMTQRYETAKVDEARDTSTFQILDSPTLPTYKSRPKRSRIVLFGLLGGLLLAGACIVLPAWWRQRMSRALT